MDENTSNYRQIDNVTPSPSGVAGWFEKLCSPRSEYMSDGDAKEDSASFNAVQESYKELKQKYNRMQHQRDQETQQAIEAMQKLQKINDNLKSHFQEKEEDSMSDGKESLNSELIALKNANQRLRKNVQSYKEKFRQEKDPKIQS